MSRRCEAFILTERFHNVIAVPISLKTDEKPFGILKLENKKDTATGRVYRADEEFPLEDFSLAKILALMIAVAYQQRRFADLWSSAERERRKHRTLEPFLQSVTSLLVRSIPAEAASVFIRSVRSKLGQSQRQQDVFMYAGGIGYKPSAEIEQKVFEAEGNDFIARVAQIQIPWDVGERELSTYKFSDLNSSWLESGSLRNVLGIPLMDRSHCIGVLRVENKLPSEARFDRHDRDISKAFAEQQIAPAVIEVQSKRTGERTEAFKILEDRFGKSESLKKSVLLNRVKEVEGARKLSKGSIAIEDCAKYLQVSKPYFYQLRREALSRRRS